LLREAVAIHRRNLGRYHPETCRDLLLLGRAEESPGSMKQAEQTLAGAAEAFERARLAGRGEHRALLPLASPYPELALARLANGRTDDAWSAAERGCARTLADLVLAADRETRSPADRGREDSLAQALTSLESACEALPVGALAQAASRDT